MADLLVRGVDDDLVEALKKRAGAHGRSQEAELRIILASVLLSPPRRNLAELLAAMPPLYQQRSPLVSKKPGGATDEQ